MARQKEVLVLDIKTMYWTSYESQKVMLEENDEWGKAGPSNAKFRQGLYADRYFFCDVDHKQLVLDNLEELLLDRKITSIKFPREVTAFTTKFYCYDTESGEWNFFAKATQAVRYYQNAVAANTFAWYATNPEEYLIKDRFYVIPFDPTIDLNTVVIPGFRPAPKTPEERDALAKELGLFPYSKWEKLLDDNGKMDKKKMDAFLEYCEKLADAEDGRGNGGKAKRKKVVVRDRESNEVRAIFDSINDAQEATKTFNLSKILRGGIQEYKNWHLVFEILPAGEPEPLITYPLETEEDTYQELEFDLTEEPEYEF